LWTSLTLIASKSGEKRINYCTALFVFLLACSPLNAYIQSITGNTVAWLNSLTQSLTWIYGPLIVILLRFARLQPVTPAQYMLHSLPFLLVNLERNLHFIEDRNAHILLTYLLLLQVLIYCGYAAYDLLKFRKRYQTLFTGHKGCAYYWLLYLVAGLTALTLIDIAIVSRHMLGLIPEPAVVGLIASCAGIYICTIALFILYQPEAFKLRAPEESPPGDHTTTPRSIELSHEAAAELDAKLKRLIATHKPHMDETISLAKLASLLGVTRNQLSELLNVHNQSSFYDYINNLRYLESIALLRQGDNNLTMYDIAYRSGFNNRNTFYRVFKEKTGQTPAQYKRGLLLKDAG
jgi:AraC-like DNA-binding protein